jgi:hypothetical protein
LPQERDEEFRGELRVRSVEFCRQRHRHLLGGVKDSGPDRFGERAQRFAGGLNVQHPLRYRLGLDGNPASGTTWLIEGNTSSKVRAEASRWVNASLRSHTFLSVAMREV